jgi:hypothetical protein
MICPPATIETRWDGKDYTNDPDRDQQLVAYVNGHAEEKIPLVKQKVTYFDGPCFDGEWKYDAVYRDKMDEEKAMEIVRKWMEVADGEHGYKGPIPPPKPTPQVMDITSEPSAPILDGRNGRR